MPSLHIHTSNGDLDLLILRHFTMDGHSTNPNSNPSSNTRARKRTSLACDTCRRQKEKCEGGPPCWRCQRLGRQCTIRGYPLPVSHASQSQGQSALRSPGHAHGHGYRSESVERVEGLERIVRYFVGDVSLDEEGVRRVLERLGRAESQTYTGQGQAGAYHPGHGQAQAQSQSQTANVDESFDVQFVSREIAHYSGEFSHWNFSQKLRRKISQIDRFGVKEYWRPTQLQSTSSTNLITQTLSHLPPRLITEFLIEMFFKYASGNLFYIEEDWILQRVERAYSLSSMTAGEYTLGDIPWICSLFAVLAIGTQVAHMEEFAATGNNAQDMNPDVDLDACSEDSVGLSLYHIACRLVPDVLLVASHESVQASLLLALYALPVSTGGLSYSYLGIAVKMAIQNGMHRKFVGDCEERIIEVRNRVFWTACMLDKRISILHGRPASIAKSDISADLPRDTLGFKRPDYSNFMAFIRLSEWLGDVAETLTLLRNCPKKFIPEYMGRLIQLRTHTDQWWSSQASARVMRPDNTLFRQNAHLKLAYLLIHIYMGRPFMFAADSSPPQPSTEPNLDAVPDSRKTLVQGCTTAALQTLSTLCTLSTNIGLCRASYTEFSSCRAALLVILADRLISRDLERYTEELARGMNLIRVMSGGSSNESEISYLQALDKAICAAVVEARGTERDKDTSGAETNRGGRDAYARFKHWTRAVKGDRQADSGPPVPGPGHMSGSANGTGNGNGFGAGWMPDLELSSFSPLSFMNSEFRMGGSEDGNPAGAAGLMGAWSGGGFGIEGDDVFAPFHFQPE
ncbi:fungal-specific transcription factor domain-containing protein [Aspergillus venezuelensis]